MHLANESAPSGRTSYIAQPDQGRVLFLLDEVKYVMENNILDVVYFLLLLLLSSNFVDDEAKRRGIESAVQLPKAFSDNDHEQPRTSSRSSSDREPTPTAIVEVTRYDKAVQVVYHRPPRCPPRPVAKIPPGRAQG